MNRTNRHLTSCYTHCPSTRLSASIRGVVFRGRSGLYYALAVVICIHIAIGKAAYCSEDGGNRKLDASTVRRLSTHWEQAQTAMLYAQWGIAKDYLLKCRDSSNRLFPKQHWCPVRLNAELAFAERAAALDNGVAQSLMKVVELYRQSLRHLGARRYTEGITAASESLKACEVSGFGGTVLCIKLRDTLGRILIEDQQYEPAAVVLRAALQESTELLAADDVVVITMQMRLGQALHHSRQVYDAERHYRTALDCISKYSAEERQIHRGARRLEYSCCLRLSYLLCDLQDYEMALKTLQAAALVRNRDGDIKEGERAFEMILTGLASEGNGQSDFKIDNIRQLIGEMLNGDKSDGVDVDDAAHLYALLLFNTGRISEGNDVFDRLEQLLADSGSKSGSSYLYLQGMWHAGNSRLEEALIAFRDSVTRSDRARGETHPELIGTLREYIRVAERLGRTEDVMRLKRRLKLCEISLAEYKAQRAKWLSEK